MLIHLGIVQDSLRQFKHYISLFATPVFDDATVSLYNGESYVSIQSNEGLGKANISKIEATGEVSWQKKVLDSTDSEVITYINSIATDGVGNIIAVGGFENNMWTDRPSIIIKMNASGDVIWQKSALTLTNGYNYTSWNHVKLDSQNNIYVSGWVSAMENGNETQSGMSLVKYSANGNAEWGRFLQNGFMAMAMSVDSQDNIVLGSVNSNPYPTSNYFHLAKYSSSGQLLFQKYLTSGYSDAQQLMLSSDSSGNTYMAASVNSYMTVIKIDSSGAISWQRRLNTSMQIYSSTVDSAGNLYLCGTHLGYPVGGIIVKISPNGTLLWQRRVSDASNLSGYNVVLKSIDCDDLGNIVVSGQIYNSTAGSRDIISLYLPSDGSKTGTYTVGSKSIQYESVSGTTTTGSYLSTTNSSFNSTRTVTIYDYPSPLEIEADQISNFYVAI